ncbi:unnamed protein product [Durusdinium trenchii]|uniref:Pentatricopeptide repeat-containing protein, chloroplastic n=1 Tax=Durusdinium trenchii TaxID=1381693 RepID=A0ABP0KVC5_9DINO
MQAQKDLGRSGYAHAALIAAARKTQQWTQAVQALAQMKTKQLQLNVVLYSAAISTCEKALQWKQAVCLLQEAETSKIEIDVILCSATVSSCGQASQWQHALGLFHSLRDKELQADTVAYGAAIGACKRAAEWQRAVCLLDDAQRNSVQLNSITFNSAISACEDWQCAVMALKLMANVQVKADSISFNAVMAACDAWQQALAYLRPMGLLQIRSDPFSFSSSLSTCRDAWQRSLALFQEACAQRGVTLVTLNALVGLGKNHGWAKGMDFAMRSAKELHLQIDMITYSGLLHESAWQDAFILLSRAMQETLASDEISFGAAATACQKAGRWQGAVLLLQDLRDQHGVQPDALNFHATIAPSTTDPSTAWRHSLGVLQTAQSSQIESVLSYSTAMSSINQVLRSGSSGASRSWDRSLSLMDKWGIAGAQNALMNGAEWFVASWLLEDLDLRLERSNKLHCLDVE